MPVIHDLVVDQSLFFQQYESIKPCLINHEPAPAIERLQSPGERAKLDGLFECILCGCGSSQCPILVVESRKVRRSCQTVASLAFHHRQPRSAHGGTVRAAGGPVQLVPLPQHLQLFMSLPQRSQSHGGHRRNSPGAVPKIHLRRWIYAMNRLGFQRRFRVPF